MKNIKHLQQGILSASLFGLLTTSCGTAKTVTGSYCSNFPVEGFYITRIDLKKDSTFDFHWGGDVMFDSGKGCYDIVKDTVIFSYNPDTNNTFIDSTGRVWQDDSRYDHSHRPYKLLFRHGNLWPLSANNKLDKKKFDCLYRNKKGKWLRKEKRTFLVKLRENGNK